MIEEPLAAEPEAGPQWKVLDAVWAILAGIVTVAAALAVVGTDPTVTEIFTVVLPAQEAGTLGALYLVSRARGTGNLVADLGLRFRQRDGWLILVGIGLQIVLSWALTLFVELEEAPQEIARLSQEASGGTAVVAFLLTVIVVPVVEEAVFRGVLLGSLQQRLSQAWAIGISAATFSVFHLAGPGSVVVLIPLFVVGLVLGYVAAAGGIGRSMVLHAGFNLIPAVVLFFS